VGGRVRPQQRRDSGRTTLTATPGKAPVLRRAGQGETAPPVAARLGAGPEAPVPAPRPPPSSRSLSRKSDSNHEALARRKLARSELPLPLHPAPGCARPCCWAGARSASGRPAASLGQRSCPASRLRRASGGGRPGGIQGVGLRPPLSPVRRPLLPLGASLATLGQPGGLSGGLQRSASAGRTARRHPRGLAARAVSFAALPFRRVVGAFGCRSG
jgi:hypothetical protein